MINLCFKQLIISTDYLSNCGKRTYRNDRVVQCHYIEIDDIFGGELYYFEDAHFSVKLVKPLIPTRTILTRHWT